jgi:hypothetical protein
MAHGHPQGQPPGTVPQRLSELAPPWQLEFFQETMKGGRLEWEEGVGARVRSLFSDAGGERAHTDAWFEPGWALYQWQPPAERGAPSPRGAGVGASARRLMALERRRMRRSTGANHLDRRLRTPPRLS